MLCNVNFWTKHGCCTHQITETLVIHTRSAQDQDIQNNNINGGGGVAKSQPSAEALLTVDGC